MSRTIPESLFLVLKNLAKDTTFDDITEKCDPVMVEETVGEGIVELNHMLRDDDYGRT